MKFADAIAVIERAPAAPTSMSTSAPTSTSSSSSTASTARGRFSGRKLQVFDQMLDGQRERHIALELGLSAHTVHGHVKYIYGVLGVHSRADFCAMVQPESNLPAYRDISDAEVDSAGIDVEQ